MTNEQTFIEFFQSVIERNRSKPFLGSVDDGLLHNDLEGLRSALTEYLDDPNHQEFSYDWYCENLDPYDDDRALDRIVAALTDDKGTRVDQEISAGADGFRPVAPAQNRILNAPEQESP